MSGLLLALIGALALLGTPLFIVIFLLAVVLYAGVSPPIDLASLFVVMGDLMEKPYLLPIPLFTLAGFLLAESKAPQRLVRLADALVGWLPGGLAVVTICTLAFFTTFTGASGVTIIALGGLLMPLLAKRGYPEGFSLGAITASGSIGLLFFPALPVFLYATVYSLSSGGRTALTPEHLFLAGLLPGLLMVGLFAAYAVATGMIANVPRSSFSWSELWAALKPAMLEASLPLWLILLLQSGQIGLLDIATVTVAYLFVVEVFIHRDLHLWRDVPRVTGDAMALVGAIVVILAVILGFNNYLIDQEIPQAILAVIREHIDSQVAMLLALNGFLLIVGCLMDIFSALVAVLPLIIPLAEDYGIHPLHLGVIFLANLEVGYITPPVGMNLFISSLHFKKPIMTVAKTVLPFMALLACAVLAITYIQPLSLWLPGQFGADVTPPAARSAPAADGLGGDDLDDLLGDDDEDLDQYLDDASPTGDDTLDELNDDDEDLDQYLDPEDREP